ncbi:MAG: hypothetical protein LQ348_006292 [Seirophora lacunosa]|nr:MAG: hypothetical protein LQ348_006292 [Seirophora lacunosa]
MALTPVKGKKALPLSTSLFFLEQKHESHQSDWQNGLERVKARYWNGHWKECATLCQELLQDTGHSSSTLRVTCLHFYAAICYDSIARATNDFSQEKIRFLEYARHSYNAAIAFLPPTEEHAWGEGASNNRTSLTPDKFFLQTPEYQTPTKRGSTHPKYVFPTFTPIPQRRFARESIGALIPSPLHVHRMSEPRSSLQITPPRSNPAAAAAGPRTNVFRTSQGCPPCTPPRKIIPLSSPPCFFSKRRRSVTFSASSFQWLQHRSTERYNAHLAGFAELLQGHIDNLEELISKVRDVHADRRVKRLASFGGDREARAADLRERIVRLRAKGWERGRFAAERYQELCAMALAEL